MGFTSRSSAFALAAALATAPASAQTQPAWTRGGTCYEVFVRSFFDSNGDGIGDLNGLISRLDYINDGNPSSHRDLGANCIWLMPVAASPSYHGYDVSDYYRVEPAYGTNDDFKRLMTEAHRRGIRVLVDMVLNHSSDQNPWFQAALRDTASPYRSWYRFQPQAGPPGPWNAPAWRHSPVRDEYYYGVFSPGMPDLDYHNPAVREEAKRIATFWLREMGVDGFRLDAIPYLIEDGTCQAGCAGTHAFLAEWAAHVASINPEAYSVGEAWGNVSAVMPYYPDQLTSSFAFELSDSLLAVVKDGVASGLLGGYLRLQDTLPAWRWSPFLSNHDGTRTMTALNGDVARARQAATLLLTLPGLPFVYYGEEIGMTGDKPDPRLRTPMQWDASATVGFTTGTPWETAQSDALSANVATQDKDRHSLLNLYRQLIHLRMANEALATGRLARLWSPNPQVVAYLRRSGNHAVLVVANLGSTPATSVAINAAAGVLPSGQLRPRNLLGGPNGANIEPRMDGSISGYVPVPGPLAPHESRVYDLIPR